MRQKCLAAPTTASALVALLSIFIKGPTRFFTSVLLSAEVIFLYLELCSSYMASTPVLPKSASFIEFIHVYNLGLAPEEIRVQIKACSPVSHMKSTLLVNFCFPWSYLFLLILYLFHLFFCVFLIN